MPLLAGLVALLSANSPPVTVPDARFSVAVWCLPTCDDAAIEALRARVGDDFELQRVLPRREATRPVLSLRELPAAAWGSWPPESLDTVAPSLDAAQREALGLSQEVVLLAGAAPGGPKFHKRLSRLYRAVGEFAQSQRAVVEDVDTREVYAVDAWMALRAETLGGDAPLLWEQFTLNWSEDGERVVTLGLRKLGLHELALRGLRPELADDALATLVLVAQSEWERDFVDNDLTLRVDTIQNPAARAWLSDWMVTNPGPSGRAGTGQLRVTLRNTPPLDLDPLGPILEVVVDDLAETLDETWGYGDEAPLAVPVGG